MELIPSPPTPNPQNSLLNVGLIAVIGLVLGVFYWLTGFGVPCGLRVLTGWLCPFCGGTRAATALLHGDLAGAWQANPVLLIAGLGLGVRTIGWIIEVVRGRPRRWLPAWSAKYQVPVAIGIAVAWMVVRNLL